MDATTHLKSLLNISGELSKTVESPTFKRRSDDKIVWCGVLPYAVKGDEICVLLGKNKRSKKYSGFGGSPIKGETPVQCAARESEEELKGLFGDKHIIETCLDKENNYAYSSGNEKAVTYLFLYRVFFNPDINTRYIKIPTFTKETREMVDIKWFTIKELREAERYLDWYFIQDLNNGLYETLEKRQLNISH